MFHSCTDAHNKKVTMDSLCQADGTVRIVFVTLPLGMGVDIQNFDFFVHYNLLRIISEVAEQVDITNSLSLEYTGSQLKFPFIATSQYTTIKS